MGEAAGEGVLEEVEHGEEVAGGHEHVIAEPAGDDGVMHDGLVGLVLEVRLPALGEVGGGPGLELAELLFGGADLDACFDTVCRERAGAFEVPFVEDACSVLGYVRSRWRSHLSRTFLRLWITTGKVVE